ncbi:hypothetical protein SLEP1_g38118 [Rubroshorea leprosula]|uniref:Uncharacterized protein n=1 Tax=Rubroshorea leprosula TaxID=152421 RepID=A0AAV5KXR9_9ROSI|nr:hypothetical protein SLEP1_g38118 [Rubroshorea leprosula]
MGKEPSQRMSKKVRGTVVVGTEPGGGDTWLSSRILRPQACVAIDTHRSLTREGETLSAPTLIEVNEAQAFCWSCGVKAAQVAANERK